jgi:nitrogen fixation/metabolism regulation signal transduction histidine kinase
MVDGRQVGTAVLQVPRAALPAADAEFRDTVNGLLLGGAFAAGLLALLVGLAMARRTAAGVAELTAAANELAAGRRDRRAAVSNLLTNAAKFTPAGGRIGVGLAQRGGHVELAVTDTGPGIPADEQPRVFERFFRGSEVRTGGSGIGLAVVAELVAAHGGNVAVESRPGHGSRFVVRLPIIAATSRADSSHLHSVSLASPASDRTN